MYKQDEIVSISNQLINNDESLTMFNELIESLSECKSFLFSVAFINYSGLQLLLKVLTECDNRNVKGRIITSDYLNFTDIKSLRKLGEFKNIESKVFLAKEQGFHSKAYIFENESNYKIIIGSSNITQSALKSNIEWNVKIITKQDHPFTVKVIHEFEELWSRTTVIDERFIQEYEKLIEMIKEVNEHEVEYFYQDHTIIANTMQVKATENLRWLREHGENRALVVAATATGKTYMSAFDVKHYQPKRMLFVVHREDILIKAEEAYKRVLGSKINTGRLTGTRKDMNSTYLFATIQTLKNSFKEFKPNDFEYIVMDEAHHVCAPSYQEVLNYFKPKFILGMTATPERTDGMNLFDIFDNNIALEIRLREAMESDLVVPFHYFGVKEVDGINLKELDPDDLDAIVKKLSVQKRVDYVIEKMKFYGHDGSKRKALGFCANIEHAEYMAKSFNEKGIQSVCLTGNDDPTTRDLWIKKLEDDKDPLELIFTVDIFNEGVDIPSVNLVLMLRPTNSAIVFIQQLGRGMRKYKGKEYLTVLDFIGNHKRAFLIAVALHGSRYYDKDSLKVAVEKDFCDVPGPTYIQMDQVAKDEILRQLETERFNSMKYIRNEFISFLGQIGKTPYYMVDYEAYEGSPDPIQFIRKKKSYYEFVCDNVDLGQISLLDSEKVRNSKVKLAEYKALFSDENFIKAIRQLSDLLPLKRPHEFVLLNSLFEKELSFEDYVAHMNSVLDTVDEETCHHAIDNLQLKFKDWLQKERAIHLIEVNDEKINISKSFKDVLSHTLKAEVIKDILQYGLIRYRREFGNINYGKPFLKLYQTYQMVDAALLSNFRKTHSSFRGSGLITNGNDYFLFIDLNKDEDTKASIFYKDQLVSPDHFQWQTPNSTSPESVRGQNIIHNSTRGINLHLFVRKFKKIDGDSQEYIYLGKADSYDSVGKKPITVQMKLQFPLPIPLYAELTTKVVVDITKN